MNTAFTRGALGAAAFLALSAPALAHVTLERPNAGPNATYRGVLQVNHGCKGTTTTAIAVSIPDGVVGVRPMPKPGWSLAVRSEPYKKPYRLFGETLTTGPREITWSGAALPDDQYDEFVFVARVTDDYAPGATIYFPVVQTCGDQVARWTEEPAPGQASTSLRSPAPAVRIVDRTELTQGGTMAGTHDMSAMAGLGANEAPAPTGGAIVKAGGLTIERPWIRATPAGAKVAGGYLRITNAGTESDRLISTSIPLAGRGEVHEMRMDGDVMKMRPVDGGVEIKPGESVELKPGGYHLMFMDLSAPAKSGDVVRGSLTFAKAGVVDVTFQVGGMGAQTAPAASTR